MNSVLRISPGWTANVFRDFAILLRLLMIVDDLYFESIPVAPHKTYAILIVNSDAVLSGTAPAKRLQLIARRHLQVVQRHRGIQDSKFLERPALQVRGKPSVLARLP